MQTVLSMRKAIMAVLLYLIFCCSSCSHLLPSLVGINAVKITSYNIQTFFDAVVTGSEYEDFKGKKYSWSEEKYKVRLSRLCSVLESIDSDIFVFQEIENEKILQDISNGLKTQGDSSRCFSFAVFVPSRDKTLGCAVLSRFPIISCSSHAVDIRRHALTPPDMRPLVEVKIDCGFSVPLTVFTGHWKSKSGDDGQSDFWRESQESVLVSRIGLLSDTCFVFCGDCNKDIREFACDGEYVVLNAKFSNNLKSKLLRLVNPWLVNPYTSMNGSYYYKNTWEKIDHFFIGSALSIHSFNVENKGLHVNDKQIPLRYTIWNGEGYSDHLPITCIFTEKE